MRTLAALAYVLGGIHAGGHHVLPIGYAPAWSPNAERLAYVTLRNLWVADADGTHRSLLVRDADNPAWSPNGRRLAFSRGGWVWTARADGLDVRRLARGGHPAWSPDGLRIAFDREAEIYSVRWYGGGLRDVVAGTDPAYARDGRLAYVRDGEVMVGGRAIDEGASPAWSPGSRHIAYVRDDAIYVDGHRLATGHQPAWRPTLATRELLPDLEQRAPTGLVIGGGAGRWLLGFTSLVDNVGLGSSLIVGVRKPGQAQMTANQHVLLANGNWRTYAGIGRLRYTSSPPHYHWHLMRFDTFSLRRPAGSVVVSDRKSGFCLADHWGTAPGHFPGRHPRYLGDCDQYQPQATHVVEGTSVGYTDRYPAFFHGQNLDITHVPAGIYDLVHRTNPNMLLHELRYENDAASVRIRLRWRLGVPGVTLLRSCAATPTC